MGPLQEGSRLPPADQFLSPHREGEITKIGLPFGGMDGPVPAQPHRQGRRLTAKPGRSYSLTSLRIG